MALPQPLGFRFPAILPLTLGTLLCLISLLRYLLWYPLSANADVGWYLVCAERLLAGGLPFIDYVEFNLPTIVYVNIPPVLLAHGLGVNPIPVYLLSVWVGLAVSVAVTRRLLAAALGESCPWCAPALALALAAEHLWVFTWLGEFGQREHVFVIGFLPYATLRLNRMTATTTVGPSGAWILGAVGALAACLKPQFFLILLALEGLGWLWGPRRGWWWQPEFKAVVLTGLGFAAHVLLYPPVVLETYLGVWAPVMFAGYRIWESGWLDITGPSARLALAVLIPGLLSAWIWRRRAEGRAAGVLTVILAGGLFSYYVQAKGFGYHQIPYRFATGLLGALVLGGWAGNRRMAVLLALIPTRWRTAGLTVVVLTLGGMLALHLVKIPSDLARLATDAPLEALMAREPLAREIHNASPVGGQVLFLNAVMQPTYPIVLQVGRRPASVFAGYFPVVTAYHGRAPAAPGQPFPFNAPGERPTAEQFMLNDLERLIRNRIPDLIMVPRQPNCPLCAKGLDLLAYWRHVGLLELISQGYQETLGAEFRHFTRRPDS
ncbi:MAG: hypothetical protein HQL82_07720 [Magnetococcales bacterium]|nr:hypothetical protein [Magnetococcales bacterium]